MAMSLIFWLMVMFKILYIPKPETNKIENPIEAIMMPRILKPLNCELLASFQSSAL